MAKRYILWVLCAAPLWLGAQEKLVVERCSAIDNAIPIDNIWVDQEGQKWVANEKGLFVVHACDLATPADIKANERSILQYPDGNFQLALDQGDFDQAINEVILPGDEITSAFYRPDQDELWIGTRSSGLLLLKTKPGLKLINIFDDQNSKLKSNHIHTIFFDETGRQFVGTEDGVLIGRNQKWDLEERYFRFQAVTSHLNETWLLSEDMLWVVDGRNNFDAVEIDPDMVSGEIKDISFDTSGRLWIASEFLTWYDPLTFDYKVFDGADYFTSSFVNCIDIDSDGAVWVGTEDKGLYLIEEASAMTVTCLLERPLSCAGDENNAALAVKINGGQPPYRYVWDKGFSGPNPTGLAAGNYTVTVTDSKGKFEVANGKVPNPRMTLSIVQESPASHGGGMDGVAVVSIEGGVPEYTYSWDNGETTAKATKLGVGEHSLTVIDDNACQASQSIVIEEEIGELVVEIEQINFSKCPGENNNEINVRISGGQGPYQSSWSNPSLKGSQLTGLAAGRYGITVTDESGAEATTAITISELENFEVITRVTASATPNGSDGEAIAKLQGGTEPYTYNWSTGTTEKTASQLPAGEHTVVVTDAAGCEATGTVVMTEDILDLEVVIGNQVNNNCHGATEGAIELEISGGKAPFDIKWDAPELEGKSLSNLPAGDYEVAVTDVVGTSKELKIEITEPKPFSATFEVETAASMDQEDGSASVKVKGGAAPIKFKWDSGEDERIANALSSGEHSVTITDANGCELIASGEIPENIVPLTIVADITEEIQCSGAATGSIAIMSRGGRPPYTYAWSDDQISGEQPTGLVAGTYTVTVTDADGGSKELDVLLQEPLTFAAEVHQTKKADIGEANGSAVVKASGGTGTYDILWANGSTETKVANLPKGTHSITITDERGCVVTAEVEIFEDIPGLAIDVKELEAIACHGERVGAIQIDHSGGAGPYLYQVDGDDVPTKVVNGLGAGEYRIDVTDSEGQKVSQTIILDQPETLEATVEVIQPTNVGETSGSAKVKIQGGRGPYQFEWPSGEKRETALKLAAGTYKLVVTDAKGCDATASFKITEEILPLNLELALEQKNKCADDQSASLIAKIKGGKGPYQYKWGDGSENENLENLAAGDYELTITDAMGSKANGQFTIDSWKPLTVEVEQTKVASTDQADATAAVKVTGGVEPYYYRWSNSDVRTETKDLAAGTHSVEVRDENGCRVTMEFEITEDIQPLLADGESEAPSCAGASDGTIALSVQGGKNPITIAWSEADAKGEKIEGLSAGSYQVTITDALGVEKELSFDIQDPDALEIEAIQDSPASTGGSDGEALVRVTGGTAPYTYSWSTGSSTAKVENLSPGVQSVSVTDARGCTSETEVTITEDIQPLLVDGEPEAPSCAGASDGTIALSVQGGKNPITITWSEADAKGEQIEGLSAGSYQVTITDAMGSKAELSFDMQEPEALEIEAIQDSPASTGGSDGVALVRAKGGTAPYSYSWSTGGSTAKVENLPPGAVTVGVTDARGCITEAEVTITEDIKELALQMETMAELKCSEDQDGAVAAKVSGGKAPYTYSWNQAGQTTDQLQNLAAGDFLVTVTDAAGQTAESSVTLAAPQKLAAEVTDIRAATDQSTEDGKATISASGGTAPYSYAWDNGSTSEQVEDLAVGQHAVTVTDANKCTESLEFEVKQKILPALSASKLRNGQVVNMKELSFEADKIEIQPTSFPVLDELYEFLRDNPEIVVQVEGHTNMIPAHEFCDSLSRDRAKIVAEYIVDQGISGKRVYFKGFGKRQPVINGKHPEANARNQRVEIRILRVTAG